jgi:hypothetical protein
MQPVMKYPGVYIVEALYVVQRIPGMVTPVAVYAGGAPQGTVETALASHAKENSSYR